MSKYVYDCKTQQPMFWVDGEYAYGYADHQPKFYISDHYWYRFNELTTCQFWDQDGYLYAYPTGVDALYWIDSET